MNHMISAVVLCLSICTWGIAEETGTTGVKSVVREWKDTLRYGIDTEILDAIKAISDAKEQGLNAELNELLSVSRNMKVRSAVMNYFSDMKYKEGEASALALLKEWESSPDELVVACIRYLESIGSSEALPLLRDIMEKGEQGPASRAIQALGTLGREEDADLLVKNFENPEFNASLKPQIVLALGEIKAAASFQPLVDIVQNRDEDPTLRRYACDALGKLGNADAIPVLEKAYQEEEPLLQSYAISALGRFKEQPQVVPLLTEALKNSNWRVRLQAVQSLARKDGESAVAHLIFRAQKDAVKQIQTEAMKTLGEIGTGAAFAFLKETFGDAKASADKRETALIVLIEKNLDDSFDLIQKIISEEWGKKDSKFLEAIANRLSFAVSARLEPVFKRFLDHSSITMKIYGIRGIRKNRFEGLKGKLEELSKEGTALAVRKHALAALEEWDN